jgi:hypothetical protein
VWPVVTACEECGADQVRVHLDGVGLCDGCADRRVAELTGWPALGDPPGPVTVAGGDGPPVRFEVRWWRAPTGIVVELQQAGLDPGTGYRFELLGAHDAPGGELVGQLIEMARAELGRRYLTADRYRGGWLLKGDEVAGRLVGNDAKGSGAPYGVVVDGRTLSWEDLGRALQPFEGWRFRLVIEDRLADVRPDAEVIALFDRASGVPSPATSSLALPPSALWASARLENTVSEQSPTIEQVLAEFLADQQQRLAARTFRNYATVISLLGDCLNGYGHSSLDPAERARWEIASATSEEAFVEVFGPDKIANNLGEFLDYFMVHKVMGGAELLAAAGTVTKRLAGWLGEHGYLDPAAVADAVERGTGAARDLPRAEKLSRLLSDQAATATVDLDRLADGDYIEDYLMIEKVGPGVLWFEGGVGPVKVSAGAAKLAQPGWSMSVTLARTGSRWQIVEAGDVYP